MSLRAIELIHVAVPLRKAIKHASHERSTSDNLIVRATLASGEVGYGEGVPRSYVTGETIASTFETLAKFDAARPIGDPADYREAARRAHALSLPETEADPRGMAGNSARCALEMAILDAYGQTVRGLDRRGDPRDGPRAGPAPARAVGGPIQRRDHGGVAPQGADLGLEDADLRISSGEDQGRRPRSRTTRRDSDDSGGSWGRGSTSDSTPTKPGGRPN